MNNPKQITKSWNNAYLLNIPIIDEQHKKLFEIYDELSHMLIDNEPQNDYNIKQVLVSLDKYIKYHFRVEEKIMSDIGFKDIEQHKKEHSLFENKLDEWVQAFEYKNSVLVKNIHNFVKKWLVTHIMGSDANYKDDMKAYLDSNPA